jgi:hypothetical protein
MNEPKDVAGRDPSQTAFATAALTIVSPTPASREFTLTANVA